MAQLLVLVPGAGGGGFISLKEGLQHGGIEETPWTFRWGAPAPLFMFNLQDPGIHKRAETKLAAVLRSWRGRNPSARLMLLGHSAGCGVLLGALARSSENLHAERVILLAPSVSPTYDLSSVVKHVDNSLHVFHSDRDNLWLQWRSTTFGTYDNVRTPAAGRMGFDLSKLDGAARRKVIQHSYDPAWSRFGHQGGHFDALSADFAQNVLAPLLMAPIADGP